MTKTTLMLVLAALAVPLTAASLAAQECTEGYVTCLNDTWYLTGLLQTMADIECFADYLTCLKAS